MLESKINSVAAIALDTANNLLNNYYDKNYITSVVAASISGGSLFEYYKKTEVNNLLTSYITGGSLTGYATTGSIPTNYLTSGSLLGYAQLTNPTFPGTITTNFLNMITPLTPNDVIINNKFIPTAGQLSAHFTLSGGGTATWNGTYLKWSGRVAIAPVVNPELATNGIYYLDLPGAGTVLTYYSSSWCRQCNSHYERYSSAELAGSILVHTSSSYSSRRGYAQPNHR
jgi:hypothetical protein